MTILLEVEVVFELDHARAWVLRDFLVVFNRREDGLGLIVLIVLDDVGKFLAWLWFWLVERLVFV